MKRIVKIAFAVLAIMVAGLAIYETARVLEARTETPRLIAEALAKTDPEIIALPPARVAMLLTVEDPTFWTNDGTDFSSPGAGTTTLSQGLGKLIYFPRGFRPGFDKIELVLITKYALTPLATKDQILHAFLANAYLSHDAKGPVIGFAEGSRRWFGRGLSALSTDQYLALVAMLPAPNSLDLGRHATQNATRVARIKRFLAHQCVPKSETDVMLEGCA